MNLFLKSVAFLIFSFSLPLLIVEVYSRKIVIPKDFKYIDVHTDRFPTFSLKNQYRKGPVTVTNGRRTTTSDPTRPKKAAFLGDSVTFCVAVADKDCFVNRLQESDTDTNYSNFGVPGYGIMEIEATLKKNIKEERWDKVYYVYNFNDIYPAMPVLLTLTKNKDTRFSSMDEYEGAKGKWKLFVKDHFKLVHTMLYYYQAWQARRAAPPSTTPTMTPTETKSVPAQLQNEQELYFSGMQRLSQGYNETKSFRLWKTMYADPVIKEKLAKKLANLKNIAQRSGTEFIVVPHYDFMFFTQEGSETIAHLHDVLDRSGVRWIPTIDLYAQNFEKTGFYFDPGHFGVTGHKVFAEFLEKQFQKQSTQNPGKVSELRNKRSLHKG